MWQERSTDDQKFKSYKLNVDGNLDTNKLKKLAGLERCGLDKVELVKRGNGNFQQIRNSRLYFKEVDHSRMFTS